MTSAVMDDVEKNEDPTVSVAEKSGSDTNTTNSLELVESNEALRKVDIENKQAFKADDSDGRVEWTIRNWLAAATLCMLYTGSQLPLYFAGGTLTYIAEALDAPSAVGWLPVSHTLTVAAICPFVGYLQDLFGKRYIALFGALTMVIGCAVLGTAHKLGQGLVGLALAGAGAAMGELTGLAGLAETVPVKYRGYSSAIITAFVIPFAPYIMYGQLFSTHSTWRWAAWIPLIYNAITGVCLFFVYFPHSHARAQGIPWQTVLKRVDFVGAFLSITGMTLFLVALQAGGYSHSWNSAYVLCTLLIGLALIVSFALWEFKFAKYPMVPPELFRGQRVVALSFAVAFIAGMNFFSLLNFWPLAISHVWNPDPILIGWRGFAFAISTVAGAIFWNVMLSVFKGGAKWVLFAAAGLLTAFGGGLSSISPHNEVQSVALCVIASFGLGGILVPGATVAMIAAPDALITTCAALSLAIRSLGGSIGYSIYYNIFRSKLLKKLPADVAKFAILAGLPMKDAKQFVGLYLSAPAKLAKIPGVTQKMLDAALLGSQTAYADSLRYVWLTSIAFGILAMIAAAFLPNIRKFQTNRIAVAL